MRVLMWLSIGLDRRTPSEHLLNAIVKVLYKQGHTVHILQKTTNGDLPVLPDKMKELGVKTTLVEQKMATKNNFVARMLLDVQYVYKCKKFLKKANNFDCVFLQSSNVAGYQIKLLKKYLPNIPVTFNVQDIFPENALYSNKLSKNSLIYRFLSSMQRVSYKLSDKVITISEDMKIQLMNSGCDEKKISVIYNWSYQDELYDPLETHTEEVDVLITSDYYNVVYAGNIGLMQNVEVILSAAEKLKEYEKIRFFVIGDGLYRNKLENIANEKKLDNIIFHDMFSAINAPALYCKADLNLITLADNIYKTALPSKTAVCLASQKPIVFVIGKESMFAKEVNRETGAPILDSNDSAGLAQIILDCYNKKLQYNSVKFYETKFQISKNSNKYANIIVG